MKSLFFALVVALSLPSVLPCQVLAANNAALAKSLTALEDAAEGIAEGEARGAKALRASKAVISGWPSARRQAAAAKVPLDHLAAVDKAVVRLKASSADRRTANDVTIALAPLFGDLHAAMPWQIHALDAYSRAFAMDAASKNWVDAGKIDVAAREAWLRARSAVTLRPHSAALVSRFESAVQAAHAANEVHDAKGLGKAAEQIAALVDKVEALY